MSVVVIDVTLKGLFSPWVSVVQSPQRLLSFLNVCLLTLEVWTEDRSISITCTPVRMKTPGCISDLLYFNKKPRTIHVHIQVWEALPYALLRDIARAFSFYWETLAHFINLPTQTFYLKLKLPWHFSLELGVFSKDSVLYLHNTCHRSFLNTYVCDYLVNVWLFL